MATPANEQLLVEWAQSCTAAQLERVVRAYRRVCRIEQAADAQRQFEQRYLRWRHDDDGAVVIEARLPPDDGAMVIQALQACAERLGEDPPSTRDHAPANDAPPPPPDAPSPPPSAPPVPDAAPADFGERLRQAETGPGDAPVLSPHWDASSRAETRRADALRILAETALLHGPAAAAAGGDRHQVVVHIDAATLRDPGQADRCHLDDGPALALDTVRRLACHASLVTVAHASDGGVLDVGRKTRAIPPAIRRALRDRDGGCRFPTCTARRFVDGHHIRHWADGGPTSLDNLVTLCRFHHRLVHEAGYRVHVADPGATISFHRPDGTPIPHNPPPPTGRTDQLLAANLAEGPDITADTLFPDWDGSDPDYSLAVAALQTLATPR